ncbi:hypothetical protein EW026_g3951 [Hermanssonia centrifuga]|uniref:DUF6533 domain-containing protein n=1 Tax=Hermanssonia centrifuga TaxID=98765 RepID=A0A4S4KIM0_9APHY|nr:hypothetical protein EW026_g3951 [Hermanssonia centrifuga]
MSQTSSDSGALIAAFQIDLTETFAIWSMTALAAYEYILTVNQEVAMIWRRKWSLVTWLFVTNRYIMIAVIIWGVSPDTAQVDVDIRVTLGTRLSVIVADIIVLALTLQKTFGHRIDAIRAGVQTPLSALLLRDGTVYFATLLSLNIVQVLIRTVDSSDPVSQLIETLTPILISRFLLNLRQLGEPENETQSRFNSRVSIPGFRVPTLESVVGNMGADLDHGPTKEVDEGADIPVNGGHLAEAALDGISENGPGVLVTENVYGNQELPSHMA